MRKNFTQQSATEMPEFSCPELLILELDSKLVKHPIYQIAKKANQTDIFGLGIMTSIAEGHLQLHQFLSRCRFYFRRSEIAVFQIKPWAIFHQFIDHIQFLNIGRYQSKTGDDAQPIHSYMNHQPIEAN